MQTSHRWQDRPDLVLLKSKYQIVIPKQVRQQIGLEVGDVLQIEVDADRRTLTLRPVELALTVRHRD